MRSELNSVRSLKAMRNYEERSDSVFYQAKYPKIIG